MHARIRSTLTVYELSAYLKIPKSTIYKLAQEGKVPGQEVGRHWSFLKESVDRWRDQTADQGGAGSKRGRT